MRSPFGRELGACAQPGPFVQGAEALLDKALAGPFNGGDARAHGFRNLFIGQLLVGFQQNLARVNLRPLVLPLRLNRSSSSRSAAVKSTWYFFIASSRSLSHLSPLVYSVDLHPSNPT
jgi:hypothetical protein